MGNKPSGHFILSDIIEFLSDPEGMTDEEIKQELKELGIDSEASRMKSIELFRKLEKNLKMQETCSGGKGEKK